MLDSCFTRNARSVVALVTVPLVATLVCAACAYGEEFAVCLDRSEKFAVVLGSHHSKTLWKRELLRQALLLAAREELHRSTADSVLGETVDLANTRCFELSCQPSPENKVQLLQGPRGRRTVVWTHEFEDDSPWPHHREWVERMEQLSRTGFVEALQKADVTRLPAPPANDAPAGKEKAASTAQLIASIDDDLSLANQFLALRQFHQELATGVGNSEHLAGLIRTYAHLGLVTEHLWHPQTYVFKARALLYAQRWCVQEPKSRAAKQHRAYAFALVGMHGEALADLKAAMTLENDVAPAASPTWIPLIDAYCRYDFAALDRLRTTARQKQLAALLCFLAQEHEASKGRTVTLGLELLDDTGGCDRMLDTLCHLTGPGVGRLATQAGPLTLAATFLPRLAQAEQLPPPVKQALEKARAAGAIFSKDSDNADLLAEIEHRANILRALRETPMETTAKQAEPGWPVLAEMVAETSYAQVFRRAYFVGRQLGVSADEELDAYAPLVDDHPAAVFLGNFRNDGDPERIAKAIQRFNLDNIDYATAPLWRRWPTDVSDRVHRIAHSHKEALPNEQSIAERFYPVDINRDAGPPEAVSPHSPYALAVSVRAYSVAKAPTTPELERTWETAAQRSGHLAATLSSFWNERGNAEKSLHFLKLATDLDPSKENFTRLAKQYWDRGNEEDWRKTLDKYLETPNLDLNHAAVQCELAQYFAGRRQWDKALPYADAAATTGSRWALSWARTINEANQNWDAAESALVAEIERYGEQPAVWYFFCRRYGCGNLGLARQAAFPDGVEDFAASGAMAEQYGALALALEGKPSKALAMYERESTEKPSSWIAMQAAIAADQIGERPKRDAFLKQVVEQTPARESPDDLRPHRHELVDLARHLIADLGKGGTCKLDFKALHSSRDTAPERDRCSFNYFLACYLDNRGQSKQAVEYWKLCMGCPDLVMTTRTAAGYELHKRGVKPTEWKKLLFTPPPMAPR